MVKCKNLCGKDLAGRQKEFCSDKCRMQHKRQAEGERDAPQPERTIPNRSNLNKVEQKSDTVINYTTTVFTQSDPCHEFHIANFGESDCACKMCETNRLSSSKHIINHGAWKPLGKLGKTELNRVSLPGDVDYKGVAI